MLGGMFAAGLVTGVALSAGLAWRFLPPPGPPTGAEVIKFAKRELRSELQITDAQEQAIMPALDLHGAEIDALRNEILVKIKASIDRKNAAVRLALDPEQQRKFEAYEAEQMQRWKKMEKRSAPPR